MLEPIFRVSPSDQFWPHTWVVCADLVMSLTREGEVPDEHWQLYLDDLRRPTTQVVLGFGVGSMQVSSKQRRQAAPELNGKRVAAVLNSSVARGIATAFSWLGLPIRSYAFGRQQVIDAFTYLGSTQLSPEQGLELAEQLFRASGAASIDELSIS